MAVLAPTSCNIVSSAIAVPNNIILTSTLLSILDDRVSSELSTSINNLGVASRHLIIDDFPNYIIGNIGRNLLTDTTQLGTDAITKCLTSANIDASQICLFISITNTANRHLPCFGYEMMQKLQDLIPSHINVINMQDQGCSVLLKGIEVAQQYLKSYPDKYVLIVAAECHSGFSPPLLEKKYLGLRECLKSGDPHKLLESMLVIESFLFGDGAVAFLLGSGANAPSFGPITHLTDVGKQDADLIHMDEGGVLFPKYEGFPHYIMSAEVPKRGAVYAEKVIEFLFEHPDISLSTIDDADLYLIHTGSKKILTLICRKLKIDPDSEKAAYSFQILNQYGNLSSASVGFMIEKCIKEKKNGKALIISFGVGFSASGGIIQF